MAEIRLSKITRQFNIGLSTLVDFLAGKGVTVDMNPNAKISDEYLPAIEAKFGEEQKLKQDSEKVAIKLKEIIERGSRKRGQSGEEEEEPVQEIIIKSTSIAPEASAPKVETPAVQEPAPEPIPEEKPVEEAPKPAKRLFPKEGLVSIHYDGLTETVGTVQSVRPVDGKKMMEMVANIRKLSLPMRIYLRRVDNKRWYQPSAVGNYTELAVVLLLANRQGCINEIDASRFVMAIQQVAIALGGDCDTEASHEIVARAKKLYDDVVRLDVQLNFVLASKEPLNPNFVAEAARLAGFTQLYPLRYFLGSVQQIGSATIFLTLDEFDRRYLTLALDAPLAQPDTHPLRTLFSVSNDLCARLNLQLQDSRDRAINSELAQAINHQLKKYYAEMYRANIEPGSPRARVLFTRD